VCAHTQSGAKQRHPRTYRGKNKWGSLTPNNTGVSNLAEIKKKKLQQNEEEKNSHNMKRKKTPTKWLLTRISLLKSPQKWGPGAKKSHPRYYII
jgi:hypothetical protein